MCYVLGDVEPHHVHVRWHKRYFAHYGHDGYDMLTENYQTLQQQMCCVISHDKYEQIFEFVADESLNLPEDFWDHHEIPSQSTTIGLVPAKDDKGNTIHLTDSEISKEWNNNAMMSQETGDGDLAMEDDIDDFDSDDNEVLPLVFQTENLYLDSMSKVQMLVNQAKKVPEVEGILRRKMYEAVEESTRFVLQAKADSNPEQFQGTYVSCFFPLDTRTVDLRIVSVHEPRNGKKRGFKAKKQKYKCAQNYDG